MPLNDLPIMPRTVMTLFLLVDTSGSMSGTRIGSVNAAMEELPALLREVSDENADAEIKIAVMEFSSSLRWVTQEPAELESFFWNDLSAGGGTEMGPAFIELESKLSRNAFLASATGAYAPTIILLSDGGPTDSKWRDGLAVLQKNNWFRCAMRIAIAVDKADDAMLAEFTGNPETVVRVGDDPAILKRMLSRLSVVASSMQSRTQSTGNDQDDEAAAMKRAQEAVKTVTEDPGLYPERPPKTNQGDWDIFE